VKRKLKSQDIYSTCVPSSINYIRTIVTEFLDNLENIYGQVDECILFELKVILNEVLVNAVKHGNKEDEKKQIKIKASISDEAVVNIVVEDEGNGYDYEAVCNCSKPFCEGEDPLEISECGRGIMIIKSLCDNVKVSEKGNQIILAKSLL